MPDQEQDISEAMGAEDYLLGRPNREWHAPNQTLYRKGWSDASLQESAELRADAQSREV